MQTVGTVGRAGHGRSTLYTLEGGGQHPQIALEPSRGLARSLGRRVTVRGIFTVSFATGYEIQVSHVTPAGASG